MTNRSRLAAVLVALACSLAAPEAQPNSDDARVRALLGRLERVFQGGGEAAYFDLLTATADRARAEKFVAIEVRGGASRVVIQERDRQHLTGTLPGSGYRIIVDAFIEHSWRGRISTWQLDIKKVEGEDWRIADQDRLSSVQNLYRLSVDTHKQFEARNFRIQAEDLELTLVEGSVFRVEAGDALTGLILLGKGEMRFRPTPEAEKGQVKIFAGSDRLESRFDGAYVQMGTHASHVELSALLPRAVEPRELRRAEQLFREESLKSFTVDLADLTRDTWWLMPGSDDFVAEIRTRNFETLTYARSSAEAEDISVFDRRRHRNIAVYSSKAKLAAHGPFYNEDDFAPYDVLDYEIDVTSVPERQWIDGRTKMRIRVRTEGLGQLTVRLADSLVVRSVYSDQLGRLYNLRVNNQNVVLISLPGVLARDTQINLTIAYSGRLEPQIDDREALALAQLPQPPREGRPSPVSPEVLFPQVEASYLYSNRSHWYPQSTVSDYATATMQITVPAAYACIASGVVSSDSPKIVKVDEAPTARRVYQFTAERPLRYFSFLVTRLARADRWTVTFDENRAGSPRTPNTLVGIAGYPKLDLIVDANPREVSNGRSMAERAVDVVRFYESIIGDAPYSSLTVALVEHITPGGHSPGHFAALFQPPLTGQLTWRNDPSFFAKYPEFFLAHEVAHQWWGQAVGWRNYHEQWLSEGFAQYFAAMYAQHFRGQEVFEGVMRQLRKSALDASAQGPVYLGYRVGHIRNSGQAFRAIVYNKSAAVLHMLRRFLGDEAFYRGIRRFYAESRYKKVGSDDLQRAMEAESGASLGRFFDRWIYGATLPRLSFSSRVESSSAGQEVVLRFEQAGELFDLPVTVTLQYADRDPVSVVVPVREKIVEKRVRLAGPLRGVEISKDDGTLAEVSKVPQS